MFDDRNHLNYFQWGEFWFILHLLLFCFFLLNLVSLHFIFPVRIDDQLNHYPEEFFKDVFLKMSQNSQEKGCARVSFLIKLQA